ncbi:hypothetical protein C8Q80DRAFT_1328721 [Daedaleopsis nitida]|nr:hypothetical protein C8Q80DRAFT_1328721 [Daedaleopsis nitida]
MLPVVLADIEKTAIDYYTAGLISKSLTIAGVVYMLYEHAITLDREVDFYRTSSRSAIMLFALNRYLALLPNLSMLTTWMWDSEESCAFGVKAAYSIEALQFIPWAVFCGLRVYALCQLKSLAVTVFLLSLIPMGVNIADYTINVIGLFDSHLGCLTVFSSAEAAAFNPKLIIISQISVVIADLLLIAITWSKLSWRRGDILSACCTHTGGRSLKAASLATVFLRDGTVHFAALLVLNILYLIFTVLSTTILGGGWNTITLFTEPFTAALMSRFLFHLQVANSHMVGGDMASANESIQLDVDLASGTQTSTLGTALDAVRFSGSSFGPKSRPSHTEGNRNEELYLVVCAERDEDYELIHDNTFARATPFGLVPLATRCPHLCSLVVPVDTSGESISRTQRKPPRFPEQLVSLVSAIFPRVMDFGPEEHLRGEAWTRVDDLITELYELRESERTYCAAQRGVKRSRAYFDFDS